MPVTGGMLEAGQLVSGLRIERELGRGAAGVVYLARDVLLRRNVAVKVLPSVFGDLSEVERDLILNEARLIAGINSPHVVTLHRLHETPDGGLLQEMEFVEGGALDAALCEGRPLPWVDAARIFRGLCCALEAAHAARVVHGDIKPANVLFGANGQAKLTDFGLARALEENRTSVDLEGGMLGTPFYMAPEVITGDKAGIASDIWSAGVLFYQLLSGRLPFLAVTFPDLATAVCEASPEPLEHVPEAVGKLVLRCLSQEAADRPTAAAASAELDSLARGTDGVAAVVVARTLNFSEPTTRFVGREKERTQLKQLLTNNGVRLLTLLGPGGIGKTRLGQQLCADLLNDFADGTWFVDLSEQRDADGVAHAVTAALGVPQPREQDPVEVVADILQFRKPMLLVLDNFEQLLDHGRTTLGVWMSRAPQVRFVVTSRALLHLSGEQPLEIKPLPAPPSQVDEAPDPTEVAGFAAVELFVDRAMEANPEFVLDGDNAADIVSICRELDGMPLAIELAAARARIMRPSQIAQRLNKKFQLLRSTARDLSPRQKTLFGAIEWSFDLLELHERTAFMQACYFRDGFTLDAAEGVIELDDSDDAPLVMDVIQGLREKSLLTVAHRGMETRIGMYRAIREFGERKWAQAQHERRETELRERHAEYYITYAEEWNRRIPGPRDEEAFDRIDAEIGNLTLVLEDADGEIAARAALAAAETVKVRRPPRRLLSLMERALDVLAGDSSERESRLRTYLATACYRAGDWDRALAEAERAAELARDAEDDSALGQALLQSGKILRNRGDLDAALDRLQEAERDAAHHGTRAASIAERGVLLQQRGELAEALTCFEEAERIAKKIGDQQTLAFV